MEHADDSNNLLLETIRKELISIINEEESENLLEGCKDKQLKSSQPLQIDDTGAACSKNLKETELERDDNSTSFTRRSTIIDTQNSFTIDEDLQKMHSNLQESYELFQNVGERFENINFGCLKTRIKDLHLNDRSSSESIKTIVNDLKMSFDEKYMENRLNDLTTEVTTKFRNHPGEFGDIPELSEFFKTCTQLQHGMEKLRKQRNDVQNLTTRMTRIAEFSYDRVNEIHQKINVETTEGDLSDSS